jgi:hypothetical protein
MEKHPEINGLLRKQRAASRISVIRKPLARSRVSNGTDVLPGIDARSKLARRFRDIAAQLAADQGGADHLSEARLQLVRRFAAASCLAEAMEAKLVSGEAIDLQEHATLCSTLVRLAGRIGIDRRSKDVTPMLRDYIEAAAGRDTDTDIDEAGG